MSTQQPVEENPLGIVSNVKGLPPPGLESDGENLSSEDQEDGAKADHLH